MPTKAGSEGTFQDQYFLHRLSHNITSRQTEPSSLKMSIPKIARVNRTRAAMHNRCTAYKASKLRILSVVKMSYKTVLRQSCVVAVSKTKPWNEGATWRIKSPSGYRSSIRITDAHAVWSSCFMATAVAGLWARSKITVGTSCVKLLREQKAIVVEGRCVRIRE